VRSELPETRPTTPRAGELLYHRARLFHRHSPQHRALRTGARVVNDTEPTQREDRANGLSLRSQSSAPTSKFIRVRSELSETCLNTPRARNSLHRRTRLFHRQAMGPSPSMWVRCHSHVWGESAHIARPRRKLTRDAQRQHHAGEAALPPRPR